jgi:hypothetical protein
MLSTFCLPSRRQLVLNRNSTPSEHCWSEPLVSGSDIRALSPIWFRRINLIVLSKISPLQYYIASSEILE